MEQEGRGFTDTIRVPTLEIDVIKEPTSKGEGVSTSPPRPENAESTGL